MKVYEKLFIVFISLHSNLLHSLSEDKRENVEIDMNNFNIGSMIIKKILFVIWEMWMILQNATFSDITTYNLDKKGVDIKKLIN